MVVKITITLAMAFVSSTLIAASPERRGSEFFIESRTPTPELYFYYGLEWLGFEGVDTELFEIPAEVRLVTPEDLEFKIDASLHTSAGGDDESTALGETTLSIAKGFRPAFLLDYIAFEAGTVIPSGPDTFASGIDYYGRIRFVGGPTRLGFDASMTAAHLDLDDGYGQTAVTSSIGYRGQFGTWHFGLDYALTDRRGVDTQESVDLVAMRRTVDGGSFYASVGRGFSELNEGWYAGFGFDISLSR
jgi:hypothetical protein